MVSPGGERHDALMRVGPYEVLGELGRGGMGVVFRVRSPDGLDAALKILSRADPGALARFERERRLMATLGPEQGFVGILDSGTAPEGTWLLMPLVAGGTLRQRLDGRRLDVAETIALGVELATALGRAHERGIVHRDLKPENVLFTREGRALVADLGLAKHFDRGAAPESVSLSRTGELRGTVSYMAPEQANDTKTAGPPADVFSLGAILYECLAGRPPFSGETVLDLFAKIDSGHVEPIGWPEVPRWLEKTVLRALECESAERFADGAALARALAGGSKETPRRRRRLPAIAVAGALGAIALALALRHGQGALPETAPWDGERLHAIALAQERSVAAAWVDRASARGMAGDVEGEIADATIAIGLDPGLGRAWAQRAYGRTARGDWESVVADATKALALDPRLGIAWESLSVARCETGELEGAIEAGTKAIELEPGVATCWGSRGKARLQSGDMDGAIEDLDRTIALDPGVAAAWANRAQARASKNDYDGGIGDATKAIDLDPRLATAWGLRGALRAGGGEVAGGLADLERCLALEPTGPNAEKTKALIESLKTPPR